MKNNENDALALSIADLRLLTQTDLDQLIWLTNSILLSERTPFLGEKEYVIDRAVRNCVLVEKGGEKPFSPSKMRSGVSRIDLEFDYEKTTGLVWQKCSLQIETLLCDLKSREYFKGYFFDREEIHEKSLDLWSLKGLSVHRIPPGRPCFLLVVQSPVFSAFRKLQRQLTQVSEEQKYKHEKSIYSKSDFRYDGKNHVLHKDFFDQTLVLKKIRGKNNKIDLLEYLFSKKYKTGEWITSDTDALQGKMTGEQLYHAAYDLNADIRETFQMEEFFEIDHQFKWVKSNKV